jgi:ribose/xylose/arabinose/galactoside ABC-type transport system permease subunit
VKRPDLRAVLALLGPFAGLVLVFVLFAAIEPALLSAYNLRTIAVQTAIVALGAIGMTFVIVSGGIDLSQGSVIALSSVVTARCLSAGWSPLFAAAAGAAAGATCGLGNGLLVVGLRVVPFIATLGTLLVVRGLAKELAGNVAVNAEGGVLVDLLSKAPDATFVGLPAGVWLVVLLAVAASALLRATPFGLHVRAIGSNEPTARLCGVPVERTKVAVYTLGGLFAGLAGVLMFARITQGDPTAAAGKELEIIAAVVIGGGSLSGGEGGILGSMVGALVMSTLAFGCSLTGVATHVQEIVVGAIIVAAVAVDRLRHRGT